ncbi:MAG: hypothetical protein AUH42_04540 [Gemmatimonadetes bacterium 13_1_40CM_70_11]|nr:MAG: hypothetical protein AUH42_04540 [Gemmatimonadetes bacterium 13_1_40CM_70_11]
MALVDRVKKILLQPNAEWAVINAELTNSATLYKSYIIPLAAIGPVCYAVGISVFGLHLPFGFGTIRYSITTALTQAVVRYALSLLGVFLFALIIDALAPSFGGQKNQVQALKVSAYSSTAAWVVGVVGIFPNVGILAILGLYSLYLLWAGLPVCMKSPKEKATAYTIVVILVGIVLYFVIGAVAAIFMPSAYSMGGLRTS